MLAANYRTRLIGHDNTHTHTHGNEAQDGLIENACARQSRSRTCVDTCVCDEFAENVRTLIAFVFISIFICTVSAAVFRHIVD